MAKKMQNAKVKNKNENYDTLKKLSYDLGTASFGVCDICKIKDGFNINKEALKDLDYGISIAVKVSSSVLNDIIDKPTPLYFHHYRQLNALLDSISLRLTNFIEGQGFKALPIPASQILDWKRQTAHLSHKKIAYNAGIGWLGRNNLIVHPLFGSQIRLSCVLTDMPLAIDTSLEDGCNECRECIKVCPVNAIKERQKDFDHMECFNKLKSYQRENIVGQFICGICVKACNGQQK